MMNRRTLFSQLLATGASSTLLSTFSISQALAQTDDDAEELKRGVRFLGDHAAEQPEAVQDWLRHSQVYEASKKEFPEGPHKYWANNYMFPRGEDGILLVDTMYYGRGGVGGRAMMGVLFHPWMTVLAEYKPEVTLNTPEIYALKPTAAYFQTLVLWSNGVMVYAPFPDTERRLPVAEDFDAFERDVHGHGQNPSDYRLQYVRNYVMSVRTNMGSRDTQPLRAFGFTRRGEDRDLSNLRLSFARLDVHGA
jgi:hypothetical protein